MSNFDQKSIKANVIMNCPNCGKTMILSSPVKHRKKIIEKCGECKHIFTMYFGLMLTFWTEQA